MSTLTHIAERVLNRPLLIHPDKLSMIAAVLDGRIGIDAGGLAPNASRFVGTSRDAETGGTLPYRISKGGTAIIPVLGSLVNRGAWVGASSGLTSYEGIKFQVGQAAVNPKVKSILLDIESPGGEAVGAFEAADAVRAVAAEKPVHAVVNGIAASAAYAIASAATRIVTTRTGIAGSIGVVLMHADYSKALDKAGVKPTLIFAGARKVDGNPYEALSKEVRADIQKEVDAFYGLFLNCVAAGRKSLGVAGARGTQARTFIGADAVAAGLADAVGTFESALAQLESGQLPAQSTSSKAGASMTSTKPAAPQAASGWDKAIAKTNARIGASEPEHGPAAAKPATGWDKAIAKTNSAHEAIERAVAREHTNGR